MEDLEWCTVKYNDNHGTRNIMAIKILIGGSPCTHWSIAQKNNREVTAEGVGWELFKNYLIAKEKFQPDFFLYENNKSASQAIKDQIAYELGVGSDPMARFTYINSAIFESPPHFSGLCRMLPKSPSVVVRGQIFVRH